MLTQNLRAEANALFALLNAHGDDLGHTQTQFKDWTGWDVVAHLHYSDVMAHAAVRSQAAFNDVLTEVMTAMSGGQSLIALTRNKYRSVEYRDLVSQWRTQLVELCDTFDAVDPDTKFPWFGPPMKARMFATARQMETWAHGQALYDILGLERTETDRIRDVVFIGVRTFSFCFANRQKPIPDRMPFLNLTSPSGEVWTYGDPSKTEAIQGRAVEFAQVVTQTRNVADTQLSIAGPTAAAWMNIAQCFAGPPADPPPPATRFRVKT